MHTTLPRNGAQKEVFALAHGAEPSGARHAPPADNLFT